ncbi:uncharacterized protein LOC136085381 [Hydra vulgaris]|uniref:Uncharacterized protein LOC136085381 n=1 Tax=Hydra vulgaris TaxID=6087 RepID=A0ABM4CLT9_HYDVU
MNQFEKEITFNGKRYVTKLPFRPNHVMLSDNFNIAKKRLENLHKKLKSDEKLLNDYIKIFTQYKKDGIIESVSGDEITKPPGSVCYLPHHPVIREEKETTKVRAVFDASCAVNPPSLNDILYLGPNLL